MATAVTGGNSNPSNALAVNVTNAAPAPYVVSTNVLGSAVATPSVTIVPGMDVTFIVATTDPALKLREGQYIAITPGQNLAIDGGLAERAGECRSVRASTALRSSPSST